MSETESFFHPRFGLIPRDCDYHELKPVLYDKHEIRTYVSGRGLGESELDCLGKIIDDLESAFSVSKSYFCANFRDLLGEPLDYWMAEDPAFVQANFPGYETNRYTAEQIWKMMRLSAISLGKFDGSLTLGLDFGFPDPEEDYVIAFAFNRDTELVGASLEH